MARSGENTELTAFQSPRQKPEERRPDQNEPRATWFLCRTILVTALGGWLFGYETSMIAGVMKMSNFIESFGTAAIVDGESVYSNPEVRAGLMVAILLAGATPGSLVAGSLCDKVGRKLAISLFAIVMLVGIVLQVISCHWVLFLIARSVSGVGVGGLSVGNPMYLVETIPKRLRGIAMYRYQVAISFGQFTAYIVSWLVNSRLSGSRSEWRIVMGLQIAPAALLAFSMFFLCESPRHDYRHGQSDRARRTLGRIYGEACPEHYIDEEIRQIQQEIEDSKNEVGWWACFTTPEICKRILLSIALAAGQQLTGANFFLYFGTTLFSNVGIKNPFLNPVCLGGSNVCGTLCGYWVVRNVRRRVTMVIGGIVLIILLIIYAMVGRFAGNKDSVAGLVLIADASLAIFVYGASWGLLTWLIGGELFASQYRAKGMAAMTATNWLHNFLISFGSLTIDRKIGALYGLVFAGATLVTVLIMWRFLLETKDLSLEQIADMYDRGLTPRSRKRRSWIFKAAAPPGLKNHQGKVNTD